MLVKIEYNEAFKMLMDKEDCKKVYFKHRTDYLPAESFKWEFTHSNVKPIPTPMTNFVTVMFYKEIEDK